MEIADGVMQTNSIVWMLRNPIAGGTHSHLHPERSILNHAMASFSVDILVASLKAKGLSELYTVYFKQYGISPKTPATPATSSTIETDTSQEPHIADDVEMITDTI
ncbi:hypothetical protein EVAR_10660_1 [Eumeta japonica]|uniref:Uncharacterized protein n=1 Tax=Eumeta variegata TaxID=151549 RepID=A0A4C1U758_EUMVA|nr:hypothetical protein EVAR_10660_1 [Eumeta japonica]